MASLVADNPFDTQPPQSGTAQSSAPGALQASSPGLIGQAAQYTPVTAEVNRPTETAAGQLDTLLSGDSPLMQRARTLAQQQMAGRGLVNSSMAIEAGTGAMIDRMTPIAQQDAGIYDARTRFNTDARNQAGQFNAGEQNRFGLQGQQLAFTAAENQRQRDFTTSERVGSQQFQSGETALERQFRTGERLGTQEFTAAQNALQRQQEATLQQNNFAWQSGENSLQRMMQMQMQQLEQAGADRRQSQQLAQQWAITQLEQAGITNRFDQELALRATQFNAEQLNADRRLVQQQQFTLEQMGYQAKLQRDTVPTQFASSVAANLQSGITQILADPNLTPDAKNAAIDNAVNAANNQLDWAEAFYGTQIPNLTAPARPAAPAPAPPPPPPGGYYVGPYGNYVYQGGAGDGSGSGDGIGGGIGGNGAGGGPGGPGVGEGGTGTGR